MMNQFWIHRPAFLHRLGVFSQPLSKGFLFIFLPLGRWSLTMGHPDAGRDYPNILKS